MLIRESRDQHAFDRSPGLIAVFHALHRLLAPRHPPHALSSLAAWIPPSRPGCRHRGPEAGTASQATAPTPGYRAVGRVTRILLSLGSFSERKKLRPRRP